jgi:hypothetical protein
MPESDKTLSTAADITQIHETSTTSCTSTEQTEASTVDFSCTIFLYNCT